MSKASHSKSEPIKWLEYLKALIIEVVFTAVMLALFAFVLYLSPDLFKYAPVFANISLSLGCFGAAFFTARKSGSKGWLTGAVLGLVSFAVIIIMALIINQSGLTSNTLFRFIIIMLAALIGGIIGVNKNGKHKYI